MVPDFGETAAEIFVFLVLWCRRGESYFISNPSRSRHLMAFRFPLEP
jgi:hypothetical protein